MNKIIIFENQYVHFKIIGEMLSHHGFKVFPALDEDDDVTLQNFKEVMDPIRICINLAYGYELRMKAFAKVSSFIKHIKPDLIIVEFKLSSNSNSQSGIDLAMQLRNNDVDSPIMFLSQTPFNNIAVIKNIGAVVPPYKWITKGYSDDTIISSDYFNKEVIPQINMIIKER